MGAKLANGFNNMVAGLSGFIETFDWAKLGRKPAELLNSLVSGIKWAELGKMLGNGLNGLLKTAYTFMTTFDWKMFGVSVATGLNNAIATLDWNLLGRTIATKFTSLIAWMAGFVKTLDWALLGKSIGDAFNGFVDEFDPALTGQMLSDALKGALDMLSAAIQEFDWYKLGDDIADFLKAVDWEGVFKSGLSLIGSITGAIAELLGGLFGDAIADMKDYFGKKIEDAGGDIVFGIWDGIVEAIGNAAKWVYENIFLPIWNGVKDAFGIHSPSTVMAELGDYVMQGFLNGITALADTVTGFFSGLRTDIQNTFADIGGWFSERWTDIKGSFGDVGAWFGEEFGSAKANTEAAWTYMPAWFDTNVTQPITGFFEGMWTGLQTGFTNSSDFIQDIFNKLVDIVRKPVNLIIDIINGMITGVVGGINTVIRAINSIKFTVPDWIPGIGGKGIGFNLSEIAAPQIPKLAAGGIVTQPTLAMIGERGKEAVMPLENNTGWINALADTVAGAVVQGLGGGGGGQSRGGDLHVTLEVSGRRLAEATITDYQSVANRRGITLTPRTT